MKEFQAPLWLPQQQQRLQQLNIERCVDMHCHVLPGLDDGPADIAQALEICSALAEDGITTVIATPHQLGRYNRHNSAEVILAAITELTSALATEQIPLELHSGGEVRIDERLAKLMKSGEIMPLAGAGKHLLLELPNAALVDPIPTIKTLLKQGVQPIIAHPERHRYLAGKETLIEHWVQIGAIMQLTAGSLIGESGQRAYDQAWQILNLGLASIVATDAHDTTRRPPRFSEAIEVLAARAGTKLTRELCALNPLRVLRGETILPFDSPSLER